MARVAAIPPLDLEGALAAADRVLAHPSCNAMRVSLQETVTFAILTRQYVQLGRLAALAAVDPAAGGPGLLAHLRASGFLSTDPAPQPSPEAAHG